MDPFADLAGSYDAWYETLLGAFVERLEMEAFDALLGPGRGILALEVGAGTARIAAHLAGKDSGPLPEPSGITLHAVRSHRFREAYRKFFTSCCPTSSASHVGDDAEDDENRRRRVA